MDEYLDNKRETESRFKPNYSKKSKKVALVLCILFGWLGVHNFYAGNTGYGFLYLFTFGACGIGWILDIYLIAKGLYKDGKDLLIMY